MVSRRVHATSPELPAHAGWTMRAGAYAAGIARGRGATQPAGA
jgi:hypothetical protein